MVTHKYFTELDQLTEVFLNCKMLDWCIDRFVNMIAWILMDSKISSIVWFRDLQGLFVFELLMRL